MSRWLQGDVFYVYDSTSNPTSKSFICRKKAKSHARKLSKSHSKTKIDQKDSLICRAMDLKDGRKVLCVVYFTSITTSK